MLSLGKPAQALHVSACACVCTGITVSLYYTLSELEHNLEGVSSKPSLWLQLRKIKQLWSPLPSSSRINPKILAALCSQTNLNFTIWWEQWTTERFHIDSWPFCNTSTQEIIFIITMTWSKNVGITGNKNILIYINLSMPMKMLKLKIKNIV